MATKRTTKRSTKKAVKRSSKKSGGSKKPSRSKQGAELLGECGQFEAYVEGNTLCITITGDAEFDAAVVIEGHACRSELACRIVNGQWEC